MKDLFKGYKVIELSSVLAGPFAGMLFSELGAEVIKIENKTTNGDVTRGWKGKNENSEATVSAYYSSVNVNKQVRMMDLTKMNDINKVYELIKTADIVITNFKYGDDYKFALDYGRVKEVNPSVIYAKLSGFESEPKRAAFDVVVQAECGYMSMNGQPDGPPTKMPVALMDVLAGHQLRSGILAALLRRTKTKKGALVEVSLEASAISGLVNQGTNYLMNKSIPERLGSRHPNIALYGEIATCADGKELVLAIGTQSQFEKLCILLDKNHLTTDPKYITNNERLKNLEELSLEIAHSFKLKNMTHWIKVLNEASIPFGEIKNLKSLSASSTAKNMIITEEIEGVVTKRFSTVGFKIG